MSLAALTPQFGNEMEDSAMQEDHPVDSAIAIDMESPKHHALNPQGTSYAESTAATTFWSHSQSQETADQLVDIEFETAGAYEDDGMMAATEVEMTAAVPYEEENELEMAYESGQPEFNYEVEDAEVRDAELTYGEHSHDQHAASHFTPLDHEQLPEPIGVPAPGTESFGVSDPLPPAEAVANASFQEAGSGREVAPAEGSVPDSLAEPASDPAGETHPSKGVPASSVETTTAEDPTYESTLEHSEEKLVAPSPHEATPPLQSPEANLATTPVELVNAEEPVATYEGDAQEEVESRYEGAAPPVLLTTFSESSKSSMIALFNEPDVAMIPSSSKSASDSPVVYLDQHQYLFGEPVAVLLAHLRTELLQADPEVMSPSEFEYKEVQLVVRDLQLVLTEDNIHSREISLFDLESMHRSCGLSGYLHLDFSLQPRFIDRYRAIRQALDAQATMNNSDPAAHQEATEGQENVNADNIATPKNQLEDFQKQEGQEEAVEGDRTSLNPGDAENQSAADEEDGKEPPLPLDDGEASSWSEEQEEDGQEVAEEYRAEAHAEEGWENTVENDTVAAGEALHTGEGEEGAYNEEYVHEDDYVLGDLLRIEDEDDSTAENGEQPVAEDPSTDAISNDVNETAVGDYDDAGTEVTNPNAEVDENPPEEYPVRTANTLDDAEEYRDEGATVVDGTEYVDDENEWDDLGYNADPRTAHEDSAFAEPTSTHHIERNPALENKTSNGSWNGVHEAHVELTPPQRKRSFSEVEAEPEGDLTLSPGSKKPRHL